MNIKTTQIATATIASNLLFFEMTLCDSSTKELFSGLDIILVVTNGHFVVGAVVVDANNSDKLAGSKTMRH